MQMCATACADSGRQWAATMAKWRHRQRVASHGDCTGSDSARTRGKSPAARPAHCAPGIRTREPCSLPPPPPSAAAAPPSPRCRGLWPRPRSATSPRSPERGQRIHAPHRGAATDVEGILRVDPSSQTHPEVKRKKNLSLVLCEFERGVLASNWGMVGGSSRRTSTSAGSALIHSVLSPGCHFRVVVKMWVTGGSPLCPSDAADSPPGGSPVSEEVAERPLLCDSAADPGRWVVAAAAAAVVAAAAAAVAAAAASQAGRCASHPAREQATSQKRAFLQRMHRCVAGQRGRLRGALCFPTQQPADRSFSSAGGPLITDSRTLRVLGVFILTD